MITLPDYMTIDGKVYTDVDDAMIANAQVTVSRVNTLLEAYRHDTGLTVTRINSGFRTLWKNAAIHGAAKHSKHLSAQAVDLDDDDGILDDWCLTHAGELARCALWQEFPGATKGWTHLQSVPYGSYAPGRTRWFYP